MEKKKSTNVLLVILGVLVIVDMIVMINTVDITIVPRILALITMAFVALYAFWLYKIPHGNLLKYTLMLFAFAVIITAGFFLSKGSVEGINKAILFTNLIAGALMCYCAGRLNKVKRNGIILIAIDVIWFIHGIWACTNLEQVTFLNVFGNFRFFTVLTVIIIAYFMRYKEHREAGLLDKDDADRLGFAHIKL